MGINIADNFAYNGKKPMDNRTEYTTLAAMKAVVDANINEGCICYNKEDGKYYTFKSTNTVDATTGKWREFETGGGGQTYNDFTGATASTAGAHGLVPAPSAGDEGKVLFGNGLWGALPSVDLSVLSNEAFQLSYDEKPIGTWTDSNNVTKLLYQKTVYCGALTNAGEKSVSTGLSNVIIRNTFGTSKSSMYDIPLPYPDVYIYYSYSDNKIYIRNDTDRSSYTSTDVTLRYTKTTDSPLPAGVKFAGVTSAGEVIYKKHISGNISIGTNDWHQESLANLASLNIDKYRGAYGVWTDSGNTYKNVGNGDNLYIFSPNYDATTKYLQAVCVGLKNETVSYDFDYYFTLAS